MRRWWLWGLGVLAAAAVCAGVSAQRAARPCAAETSIPDDRLAVQAAAMTTDKLACLTFDDGPSVHTAEIAAILADYDAPATFFVTAQPANEPYFDELPALAAAGHQIALHSASHRYADIYESPTAFWLDIKALRQALAPYLDPNSLCWLRFPGGSTNTISHRYGGRQIMQTLTAEAAEKGYRWIDWNVCGEDATAAHPDAAAIFENVRTGAEGRDVCVVLLHDTAATGETVRALPDILAWFAAAGYRFCTVEEMFSVTDGGGG